MGFRHHHNKVDLDHTWVGSYLDNEWGVIIEKYASIRGEIVNWLCWEEGKMILYRSIYSSDCFTFFGFSEIISNHVPEYIFEKLYGKISSQFFMLDYMRWKEGLR